MSCTKNIRKKDFSKSNDADNKQLNNNTVDAMLNEKPNYNLGKVKGHEARWNEMFYRLLQYREKHGHCLVPNRYKQDPKLGTWVATQRRQYKALVSPGSNDSTPITFDRAMKLKKIGFDWSPKAVSSSEQPAAIEVAPTTMKQLDPGSILELGTDASSISNDAATRIADTDPVPGSSASEVEQLLGILKRRQISETFDLENEVSARLRQVDHPYLSALANCSNNEMDTATTSNVKGSSTYGLQSYHDVNSLLLSQNIMQMVNQNTDNNILTASSNFRLPRGLQLNHMFPENLMTTNRSIFQGAAASPLPIRHLTHQVSSVNLPPLDLRSKARQMLLGATNPGIILDDRRTRESALLNSLVPSPPSHERENKRRKLG